jgi:hypothetical protein
MALDEFNEEELFSGDELDNDEGHSDGSAEDVEQQDRRQSFPGAKQKGVDITGTLQVFDLVLPCPPCVAALWLARIVAFTCFPPTPVPTLCAGCICRC